MEMTLDGYKYPLNEIFVSVQGEGAQVGRPVIFVRFSKCNMSCHFCDTNYEPVWKEFTLAELIHEIKQQYWAAFDTKKMLSPAVLLTGGEPTLYPLKPLLEALKDEGYWIGIESNGVKDFSEYRQLIDHITVSPKAPKGLGMFVADELRLVVQDFVDINYMKHIEEAVFAHNYFLSPMELDGKFEKSLPVAYQLLNWSREVCEKKWSLSIQTHKLCGVK